MGKLFTLPEAYTIVKKAGMTMPFLLRAQRKGQMTEAFKERLMLAVTEVNGCRMCSWAHTRIALEAGLSPEEIGEMLAGQMEKVPADELPAALFAQHYADTRGIFSREAWTGVVARYGWDGAMGILGAVRGIMLGNAYGIPLGSLLSRLQGRRAAIDPRSSAGYELLILLTAPAVIPIALLHAFFARLLRVPVAPRV
jgi:AhpD family alkylhydroperoxidase